MSYRFARFSALALLCTSLSAIAADSKEFNQNIKEADYSFKDQTLSLPDYPAADGKWVDLYITPTFTGKPKILLSSIHIHDNKSLSYVLNNQSGNNIDNISFENLRCSVQSFRSEYNNGFRQIAFADTYNKRWIESKNAPWRDVGSNLSTSTPVQEMLSRVFCDDGMPRNDAELTQRLIDRGTFNPTQNRGIGVTNQSR